MPSGRRLFLIALVASLCATAGLAIFILLLGDFGETEGRILATTGFLSFYSLLSLPGGVLLDQGRVRPLAWTLIALAVLSFVLALALVWRDWNGDEDALWKLVVTASALTAACSQTAANTSRRRADDRAGLVRLYWLSIALAFVVAAMVSLAAWKEIDSEGYYRALGALVVTDLLAVVLQPLLRRMGRQAAEGEPGTYRLRVTFVGEGARELEYSAKGRDFAAALADAVRALERDGARVERIERLDGGA